MVWGTEPWRKTIFDRLRVPYIYTSINVHFSKRLLKLTFGLVSSSFWATTTTEACAILSLRMFTSARIKIESFSCGQAKPMWKAVKTIALTENFSVVLVVYKSSSCQWGLRVSYESTLVSRISSTCNFFYKKQYNGTDKAQNDQKLSLMAMLSLIVSKKFQIEVWQKLIICHTDFPRAGK